MENEHLYHHGTRGMKWGIRLYQNKDGSLTPAGRKRYNKEVERLKKETEKVKAAEKVAANKKKVKSKLDQLEEKQNELNARKKALKDGGDPEEAKKRAEESLEEKKKRLLNSVDAKELYDNKDILSTAELNDRINRIDTEARLKSKIVIEHKKTGMDYIDDMKNRIDKGVGLYKSVDKAYAEVANSTIGKTLAKKLGLEPPRQSFNMREAWRNRNRMSNQELAEFNRRLVAENSAYRQMMEIESRNNNNNSNNNGP